MQGPCFQSNTLSPFKRKCPSLFPCFSPTPHPTFLLLLPSIISLSFSLVITLQKFRLRQFYKDLCQPNCKCSTCAKIPLPTLPAVLTALSSSTAKFSSKFRNANVMKMSSILTCFTLTRRMNGLIQRNTKIYFPLVMFVNVVSHSFLILILLLFFLFVLLASNFTF